jgi:hypothetical protein
MTRDDDQVFMVLGVDREHRGHIAVVVGAEDHKSACRAYQRSHPGCSPVSWPSLRDLKQSVTAMEMSVSTGKNDFCPVIIADGAEVPPDAPDSGSAPCPVAVVRVLDEVRASLDDHGFMDPFENNGAAFTTRAFVAHSQRWDNEGEPGTFHWRDLKITWYKHLNRETTINRIPSKSELADMRAECLAAIELEAMAKARPV